MKHPAYPNPPVVEAVVALRFHSTNEWSAPVMKAVAEKFREEYSGKARQEHQLELRAEVSDRGATSTATRSEPRRLLLPTEDGKALVGIAENLLTVHVLRPYPGWERFMARVRSAADLFIEATGAVGVAEVTIRYIDRVALPAGADLQPTRYFQSIPFRPSAMPGVLEGFQCVTQARDPVDGVVAVLTLATAVPNPGEGFVMLYDLNLIQAAGESPMPLNEWPAVLERLHARQYEIFRGSITPATEGLFQ